MKCIVCDRCKKIIEDKRKCRVITCAKPIKPDREGKPPCRGNDPQFNDILWEKELCTECAEELELFIEPDSGTETPPIEEPKDPEEPIDPEDPTNPETPDGNGGTPDEDGGN